MGGGAEETKNKIRQGIVIHGGAFLVPRGGVKKKNLKRVKDDQLNSHVRKKELKERGNKKLQCFLCKRKRCWEGGGADAQ